MKLSVALLLVSFVLGGCKLKNPTRSGAPKPVTKLEPIRYNGPKEIKAKKQKSIDIPKNTKVTVPEAPGAPKEHERYTQKDKLGMDYNPKVDILVVMDNSDSMFCDQKKLRQNINRFTNVFIEKQGRFLDFHIGVVSPWDSKNFGSAERDCQLGQLHPVGGKNSKSGGSCSVNTKLPYVTRETPDLVKSLADTLHIGTQKYKKGKPEISGPEQEELFSPVLAALSPETQEINKNFRRSDAHLAVIFISDTDDVTPDVLPTEMSQFLMSQATDNVSVSTYAVLARYNELINYLANPERSPLKEYPRAGMFQCRVNPVDPHIRTAGGGPFRMESLLKQTGGIGFDLKDPEYGDKLAFIGENIVQKTLQKVIALDFAPDLRESQAIIVKYGTQVIPEDEKKGWKYNFDERGHTITINDGVVLDPEKGAGITIEYTKVKATIAE